MQSATPIYQEQIAFLPFYITRTAIDFTENGINREEGFDEYQIMQCTEGIGEFICQDMTYEVYPSDIVIFSPSIAHKYHRHQKSNQPWKMDWICFFINGADNIMNKLIDQGHCVIQANDAPDLSSKFHSIVSILQADSSYHQMQASVILYSMITEILAHKQGLYIDLNKQTVLSPVVSFMEQHIKDPISIEELSSIAKVSVSYLCRKFKEIYQVSPIQYLINLRMMKARELLTTQNNLTVKRISQECGYTDVSYFCSEFKRYFGLSPSEYQKRFFR